MTIEEINELQINFDGNMIHIMNFALAFMMFGVAINLKLNDFLQLFQQPRKILIGLSSQLIILPIVTILFIYLTKQPFSMALGFLLVAACPGGNISNYATYLSKGNAALSITLTSIVSVGATIITPLIFFGWIKLLPVVQNDQFDLNVNFWDMLYLVSLIILLPLLLGLTFQRFFPKLIAKIKKAIATTSLLFFIAFVIGALAGNLSKLQAYLPYVLIPVLIHNAVALLAGYWYARTWKLPKYDAKAVSLETGIQNAGLGIVLYFNFFDQHQLGGMLLVVAWWGVWDLISALGLASFWRYRMKSA